MEQILSTLLELNISLIKFIEPMATWRILINFSVTLLLLLFFNPNKEFSGFIEKHSEK